MSDASTQRIDDLRGRFTALCVGMVPQRLQAERFENAPGEFDHLIGDSRCIRAHVGETELVIGTDQLLFECHGDYRWVGDFAIRIDTKSRVITYTGSQYRSAPNGWGAWHPHVTKDGVACFGLSGRQWLTNWFADGKLAHIGLYAIEFLCVARGDSDYVSAKAWRRATEEEIAAWKLRHPEANGSSRLASSTRLLSTFSASAPAVPRRRWFLGS